MEVVVDASTSVCISMLEYKTLEVGCDDITVPSTVLLSGVLATSALVGITVDEKGGRCTVIVIRTVEVPLMVVVVVFSSSPLLLFSVGNNGAIGIVKPTQ